MTYKEFKKAYEAAFRLMMKYPPSQAGSRVYAGKMAALADKYPDFAEPENGRTNLTAGEHDR